MCSLEFIKTQVGLVIKLNSGELGVSLVNHRVGSAVRMMFNVFRSRFVVSADLLIRLAAWWRHGLLKAAIESDWCPPRRCLHDVRM